MKTRMLNFGKSVGRIELSGRKEMGKLRAGIILAMGLTPLATPLSADEVRVSLEEITVTARKVQESLQETPVSVTVISKETMDNLSFVNIGEIQNVTPNLQFNSGFSGSSAGANFFIRGIGQLDFISTSDPGVSLFLDGVYMARTVGAALDTADIERIEVLKGPQGTLFGKNTIGGAVNISTVKPGNETDIFLKRR